MTWSFNFKSLREILRKAYNNASNLGSFFISGQEFSSYIAQKKYFSCTQQSYLRCTNSKDKLINNIKSYLKDKRLIFIADRSRDNADVFSEECRLLKFSGVSHYGFCGQDRCDFAIYTINDHSTDYYIALSFYVDRDCSSELFETYVGYVCDVLKSVFECCSISSPASSCIIGLESSCDFVFAMQRLDLPNDVIKIVATYC